MADDVARGARYAAARALTGLSQRALAKRLGISPQAISKWESGLGEPTRKNARKLADLADISLEWLLSGRERNESQSTQSNVAEISTRGRVVPLVGDTLTGIVKTRKPSSFVTTYFPCSAQSFALQVSGDSMAPDFADGDVVIIDPNITPAPGDFVFVEINDEMVLFRKFRPLSARKGKAAEHYELVPCNEDWPKVSIGPEDNAVIRGVMSQHVAPRRRA